MPAGLETKLPWIHTAPQSDDGDVSIWGHIVKGRPLSTGNELRSTQNLTFLLDVSKFDPRIGDLSLLRSMADWDRTWKPIAMRHLERKLDLKIDTPDPFMEALAKFSTGSVSMHSAVFDPPVAAIVHGEGTNDRVIQECTKKLALISAAAVFIFWNSTVILPDLINSLYFNYEKTLKGRSGKLAIIKTRKIEAK